MLALFVALCSVFVAESNAQQTSRDRQDISGLEQRAFAFMNNKEYARSAMLFAELKSRFPSSPKADSWRYNQARGEYHAGRFDNAERHFNELIDKKPGGRLVGHAFFFVGNIYFRQGNIERALENYLNGYNSARDRDLSELLEQSLSGLIKSDPELALSLRDEILLSPEKREELLSALSRELEPVFKQESDRQVSVHKIFAGKKERRSGGRQTISLALPLTGKLERYGKRLERGARLAARMARVKNGVYLNLETTDTRGEPALAARLAQEAGNSNALAMIGPLTSEEAVAVSASLNCGELATLAPAAAQEDFTRLSKSMFQMTPSPEMIGRQLAEYAYLGMPVATAAALAPNQENERAMADAFVKRFEELGGEVIAYEIFPPQATDFGSFCRKIKERFLQGYTENAVMLNSAGDTLDLSATPVEIGCIFVPASQKQLKLALPQINFHNIFTTLIGSDGLSAPTIQDLTLQNVRGVVFSSWLTQDLQTEAYIEFAEKYRDVYGETPDRLAALGYDAVNLIVDGLLSGADSKTQIRAYLETVSDYSGASGDVSFGADRINTAISMYTLVDRLPSRIDWNPPAPIPVDENEGE